MKNVLCTAAHASRKNSCHWPNCIKSFAKPSALKRHIRTHTGEKPFVCTYPSCALEFAERGNLKVSLLRTSYSISSCLLSASSSCACVCLSYSTMFHCLFSDTPASIMERDRLHAPSPIVTSRLLARATWSSTQALSTTLYIFQRGRCLVSLW